MSAASKLSVQPELLTTIAEVETRGEAFLNDGRPKVLFERHIFYRKLKVMGYSQEELKQLTRTYPDIVNPKPGGYKGGAEEYVKLNKALRISNEAAYESISMGRFQIMGFHYERCGFKSAKEMFDSANKHEREHLNMLVKFIESDKQMLKDLRSRNFHGFAYAYNGKNYRKNKYATKMENVYKQLTA